MVTNRYKKPAGVIAQPEVERIGNKKGSTVAPKLTPIAVYLTCGETTTQGQINIRYWTKRAAKIRGFNFFALIYFIGLTSMFNPVWIVHVLVPPIWIFIGPWVGYKIYKMFAGALQLRIGSGTCPACGVDTDIFPYGELEAFTATCKACNAEISGFSPDADVVRGQFD